VLYQEWFPQIREGRASNWTGGCRLILCTFCDPFSYNFDLLGVSGHATTFLAAAHQYDVRPKTHSPAGVVIASMDARYTSGSSPGKR
jgi:hypothetical protein